MVVIPRGSRGRPHLRGGDDTAQPFGLCLSGRYSASSVKRRPFFGFTSPRMAHINPIWGPARLYRMVLRGLPVPVVSNCRSGSPDRQTTRVLPVRVQPGLEPHEPDLRGRRGEFVCIRPHQPPPCSQGTARFHEGVRAGQRAVSRSRTVWKALPVTRGMPTPLPLRTEETPERP